MSLTRLLLTLLLALGMLPAHAAATRTVDDLYSGQVPVDSRAPAARQAATRDALTQVLVRLTGDVSVSLSEAAQPILAATERFLRSYRYASLPSAEPGGPAGTALVADFDPAALRQAVKNAGLPLWGEQRPVTLVWLLAPSPDGLREIVAADQASARAAGLIDAAAARGLPLEFPRMDEAEKSLISVIDVAAGSPALAEATARYAPRHVLLLELVPAGDAWRASWTLPADEGLSQRWESFGRGPDLALSAGFERYADSLAQRYAIRVAPGWMQATQLRVGEVHDLADYARVLAHLESLQLVDQVRLSAVTGSELSFALRFEGEISDLERSLQLGGLLQAGEAPPPDADAPAPSPGGLNFFAVGAQRELRYRLAR